MGIFKKTPPKQTSSATLAERIEKLQAEFSAARSRLDSAEAAAVEAAGSDADYAAAFELVTAARTEFQAKESILAKMQAAHQEALALEQADLLNRLRDRREKLQGEQWAANEKLREDRAAEETRHRAALEALDLKTNEVRGMVVEVDRQIAMAEKGVLEGAILEIAKLRIQKRELAARIPRDLEKQYAQAKLSMERAVFDRRSNPSLPNVVDQRTAEFDEVAAEWAKFEPFALELDEINLRIKELSGSN